MSIFKKKKKKTIQKVSNLMLKELENCVRVARMAMTYPCEKDKV